ncbi:hypothetical protein CEUSTIGMA_g6666.t1 [Chlamydomonas eustigma]|uniref:Patatin n=1 Tax=Chlamydomonas eustigma TaxID=1157962 RepID=A0A250X844_9CHLO|nr:hypothetical protein CEUSTIGMA_g6666.t1 [Chlamydomonas eustigma]|eukprot:GAX79226.1 hypothetical protein CEUSTIGMA_g6666.t1 [Chlamydomonas eustigma]
MTSKITAAPVSISLPGAGVLLFWQLGVLHGLKQRFDLSKVPHLGSSSGACAAALSASGACLQQASAKGAQLFDEYGIANRPFGVIGILSRVMGAWLQDTLPQDAAVRCLKNRTTLLVTTLPLFRTRPISEFTSRADLMRVVMASAHIPFIQDMRIFVRCKGSACIDGGFWWLLQRSLLEYQNKAASQTLVIKPCDDPALEKLRGIRHTILARPTRADVVKEMWERGLDHAARLAERHGHIFEQCSIVPSSSNQHVGHVRGFAYDLTLERAQGGDLPHR